MANGWCGTGSLRHAECSLPTEWVRRVIIPNRPSIGGQDKQLLQKCFVFAAFGPVQIPKYQTTATHRHHKVGSQPFAATDRIFVVVAQTLFIFLFWGQIVPKKISPVSAGASDQFCVHPLVNNVSDKNARANLTWSILSRLR
jgi:hypothetical protein